jgi:hypothetical protein
MMRMLATVRTPAVLTPITAVEPMFMDAGTGPPWPSHVPSVGQVPAPIEDPLPSHYSAGTVCTVAWLLWLAVATVVGGCQPMGALRARQTAPALPAAPVSSSRTGSTSRSGAPAFTHGPRS